MPKPVAWACCLLTIPGCMGGEQQPTPDPEAPPDPYWRESLDLEPGAANITDGVRFLFMDAGLTDPPLVGHEVAWTKAEFDRTMKTYFDDPSPRHVEAFSGEDGVAVFLSGLPQQDVPLVRRIVAVYDDGTRIDVAYRLESEQSACIPGLHRLVSAYTIPVEAQRSVRFHALAPSATCHGAEDGVAEIRLTVQGWWEYEFNDTYEGNHILRDREDVPSLAWLFRGIVPTEGTVLAATVSEVQGSMRESRRITDVKEDSEGTLVEYEVKVPGSGCGAPASVAQAYDAVLLPSDAARPIRFAEHRVEVHCD